MVVIVVIVIRCLASSGLRACFVMSIHATGVPLVIHPGCGQVLRSIRRWIESRVTVSRLAIPATDIHGSAVVVMCLQQSADGIKLILISGV